MPRTGTLETRTIWTLAGLAWGLLVGLITALQAAGFLAGVGWLFIFGDDPWPEAANWVFLGMTTIAGVVPLILLTWLGRRLGIAFESESRQRLRTRRRGWFVFGLAAGGIALGAAMAWAGMLTDRARRADREAARRQYVQLVEAAHRITDVSVTPGAPPAVEIGVTAEGERAGEYVLDWRLSDTAYDSTLAAGSRMLKLDGGRSRETVAIDTAALRSAYDRTVLGENRSAPVLVDEDFRLRLSLRPVLTSNEQSRIPESELRQLERGGSELVSTATEPFPVHFELP